MIRKNGTVFERDSSLRLDAAGLDEFRPFPLIAVDESGIVFRTARRDFGAVEGELLPYLLGSKRGAQLLVEPFDDRTRRARRSRQAVIKRGIEG